MKTTPRLLPKIATLCVSIWWTCSAQDVKRTPEFEVASVKPVPAPPPYSALSGLIHVRSDADQLEATYQTLFSLIVLAYDVRTGRISGPGWITEQHFTVLAKLPAGTTQADIPTMLQKLLADRFRLSIHHEEKSEPVYELVADRKGTKLKLSNAEPTVKDCMKRPGQVFCPHSSLAQLAMFLSGAFKNWGAIFGATKPSEDPAEPTIDFPVVDQTGLAGLYDVDLQWLPAGGVPKPLYPLDAVRFPPRDATVKATSVFGALEAIGLKLQRARHAFDNLVVDHAERVPSEN